MVKSNGQGHSCVHLLLSLKRLQHHEAGGQICLAPLPGERAKPPIFRSLSVPAYQMGTIMYTVSVSLGTYEVSGEAF